MVGTEDHDGTREPGRMIEVEFGHAEGFIFSLAKLMNQFITQRFLRMDYENLISLAVHTLLPRITPAEQKKRPAGDRFSMGGTGFEPVTPCMSSTYSNQLS